MANFGSRFLYNLVADFWISVIAAYLTGMLVNYAISKKYVFATYEGATTLKTLTKFTLMALVGLGVTTLVSIFILDFLTARSTFAEPLAKALAHCAGMGISFIVSFLGHNFLTFKSTGISHFIKGDSR